MPTVERQERRIRQAGFPSRVGSADWHRQRSGFVGNFGVLVKAYAYARAYGGEGLRQVAMDAVLNATTSKKRNKGGCISTSLP